MEAAQFLTGDGEMAARIQAHDWSASPLGLIGTWPQPLRTSLGIVLNSGSPMYLAWGPGLISFYNDAYRPILGTKAEALGRPMREVWPEDWSEIAPILARALAGEPSYFEDRPLTLERRGYPEQTWWTFSYSPLRDDAGNVSGVLCIVLETTARVIANDRLRFQIDLGNSLRGLTDAREVMATVGGNLGRYLGVNRAGYGEVDAEGRTITIAGDWTDGATPSIAGQYILNDFGPVLTNDLRAGRTVRVDDTLNDPRLSDNSPTAAFAALGVGSGIAVPVMESGRLAAVLYVQQTNPRRWRDDELAILEEVVERTREAVGRARAQAALLNSEKRFRQFAQHSNDVLWIRDVEDARIEYLSPAFEAIWGEPVSVMLGDLTLWLQTIRPDDRARIAEALERVKHGEVVLLEYRVLRPDGRVRWIRHTSFPMPDEQGRVLRAGGIAQDITQHGDSVVCVVGSHRESRESIVLLLQGNGYDVKTFASAQSFLEIASALTSGCVVLDVTSPAAGSLTVPRELKARGIPIPVIVIGPGGDVSLAVQAIKAGAVEWLERPYQESALLAAVVSAFADIRKTAEADRGVELARSRVAMLSTRERDVLIGVLSGGTNKTIGRELGISPRTVEIHRAHVMQRLGVLTFPQLILAAANAGLKPTSV